MQVLPPASCDSCARLHCAARVVESRLQRYLSIALVVHGYCRLSAIAILLQAHRCARCCVRADGVFATL